MEKKTKSGIKIAVFIISAVIAFFTYKSGDTIWRLLFAIAIGLVFNIASIGIVNVFDQNYKGKSSIADKIQSLMLTIVFPILFVIILIYLNNGYHNENLGARAWIALIAAGIINTILVWLVAFIVKMFEK